VDSCSVEIFALVEGKSNKLCARTGASDRSLVNGSRGEAPVEVPKDGGPIKDHFGQFNIYDDSLAIDCKLRKPDGFIASKGEQRKKQGSTDRDTIPCGSK
jgi:hypothetical protein